ncbi:predicted protein [Sclerotinia sclerotiorum 1980 UF-70]|uniref:Uncharacterized protein n=1 Tax=Sclerotinia sclerotiorum (strain ATCC 18683 / 1980 / Ss-1) TaxID=665079 RepID=A7F0M6_SCLS1|nr:predicted protein [Sclerotinia sclerotiorum 1980 UF-70]EDN95268.1 predicted protein [Sclerotinia sclerotiorum 1980 UF-70]
MAVRQCISQVLNDLLLNEVWTSTVLCDAYN